MKQTSKVRVVLIDAEGDAGAVLAALQGFFSDTPETARVDRAAPEPKRAAITPPAPAPEAPRAVKPVKPARAATVAPKAEAPQPESGGVRGEVYAALKAGPMTSLELVRKFEKRCTSGAIYLALKELRASGVVETRVGDDGEKKNVRLA